MGIIGWILLGLVAGLIARMIAPGRSPGGLIVTCVIGVAGAILAGLVARAAGVGNPIDDFFDASTWLAAIAGSVVLLLIYGAVAGGRRGRKLTA